MPIDHHEVQESPVISAPTSSDRAKDLSNDNQVGAHEFAGLRGTGTVNLPGLIIGHGTESGALESDVTVAQHASLPGDSSKFVTSIDQAFAAHQPVDICIWNEGQRVAAEEYIRGTSLPGDARIIVTQNPDIQSGDILSDGRTAIRYSFGGSSSGGGGS